MINKYFAQELIVEEDKNYFKQKNYDVDVDFNDGQLNLCS